MKLTPEQIEARQGIQNIVLAKVSLDQGKAATGRPTGNKELPETVQDVIGAVALIDGPSRAAEEFGVSVTTAHRYAKRDEAKETEDELRKVALSKALRSFDLLDDDKLATCKPLQLAQIAKLAADIALKGKEEADTKKAQVIIYAPQIGQAQFNRVEVVEDLT